jgi:hypothetical protein
MVTNPERDTLLQVAPREKAQQGLTLLKEAVLDLLRNHPEGLRNAEIERVLQLQSSRGENQRGWLCWQILSLLLNEGKLVKAGQRYKLAA